LLAHLNVIILNILISDGQSLVFHGSLHYQALLYVTMLVDLPHQFYQQQRIIIWLKIQ